MTSLLNQDAPFFCGHGRECGGCPNMIAPYEQQLDKKQERLKANLFALTSDFILHPIKTAGPNRLRVRADLTLEHISGAQTFGLYRRDRSGLLHLDQCPMMTPELEAWFLDFRQSLPQIKKGSVRLRVGVNGERGVWLDLANKDIQTLLAEKEWLSRLLKMATVEIGQKRKLLVSDETGLHLKKESLGFWFATYAHGQERPLQCQIASFTQPSLLTNRLLVERICQWAQQSQSEKWIELGAGIGNFSVALALETGVEVLALENDMWSLSALKANLDEHKLNQQIFIERFDFQNIGRGRSLQWSQKTGLVVDPPRSGLGGFLELLQQAGKSQRPAHLLYVSCHEESFLKDSKHLISMGYRLNEVEAVDQFPQSDHVEVLAWFSMT